MSNQPMSDESALPSHAEGRKATWFELFFDLVFVVAGTVISFALWQAYFLRVKGHGERHIADATASRRMRLWAYAHIPLYMGIASLAAGTVALAEPGALTQVSAAIYAGGLLLAVLGLAMLKRAGSGH